MGSILSCQSVRARFKWNKNLNTYLPTHGTDADFVETLRPDPFGHQFVEQLQILRSMVSLASPTELQSLVRSMILSGWTDDIELLEEVECIVGSHIRTRLTTVLREGQGKLWTVEDGERLEVLEGSNEA